MIESAQVIEVTADALIRTGDGLVYAIHICYDGVTAGDMVQLRDSLTAGAGTVRLTYVADATDQTYNFAPSNPMKFDTGIYVDVSKTGGAMYVTVVYS